MSTRFHEEPPRTRSTVFSSVSHLVVAGLTWLAILPCTVHAATYYVGPAKTGSGLGNDRSNLKALSVAISTAQPGDLFLLQPGSYGSVIINEGYGTADRWVTYRADPETCAVRAADWFESDLDRPSPTDTAVFSSLIFASDSIDAKARPKYVIVDGVNIIDGGVTLRFCVSYVQLRNCSIFGKMPAEPVYHYWQDRTTYGVLFVDDTTPSGVEDFSNVIVDSCYIEFVGMGIEMKGSDAFGENVIIRNNHISDTCSSGISIRPGLYSQAVLLDGNHIERQNSRADKNNKTDRTVVAPDGGQPNRIFTHDGVALTSIYRIWAEVFHGGTSQIRKIVAYDAAANRVTLDTPLSFNLQASDAVRFYNSAHGSGVALWGTNLIVRNNRIHNTGNTAAIYFYYEGGPTENVLIENNLVYDSTNQYALKLGEGSRPRKVGNNVIIRNNTIVGRSHDNYYVSRNARYRYGIPLHMVLGTGVDTSTIQICNNIVVGLASVPAGPIMKNNILWYSPFFESDNEGDSQGNLVFCTANTAYPGPDQFEGSGHFFVGGTLFDTYAWGDPENDYKTHGFNFNAAFALAAGSPAIGFARAEYATRTDLRSAWRDDAPDAGCYEYKVATENLPPVLEVTGSTEATVGTTVTLQVPASDPEGDPFTVSVIGPPEGATFSDGVFTWMPTQAGTYRVTFVAHELDDANVQDSEVVTIMVYRQNTAPILVDIGSQTTSENVLLSFAIDATDADNDPITYAAAGLPDGANLTGQTFSWTPTYDQAGSYEVTFTASDGLAQNSQTVAISVANVNRSPTLAALSDRSVDENGALTFDISAVDPDGDALTYSATGLPVGANLLGQTFNWTSAEAGSYEITFTASDGELADSQTVTVVVVQVGADQTAPVVARCAPAPDAIQVPLNNLVTLHLTDAGEGVDANSIVITVDNNIAYQGNQGLYTSTYGQCRRSGTKNDYQFIYQRNNMFDFDHVVTVRVSAADLAGNVMDEHAYSFATEMRAFGSNKPVSKSTGSVNKSKPATTRDAAGNIWTAWHAGSENSRDIYVARLAAGADAFGAPVRLTTDSRDQCNPDLAVTADGLLYVVWQDNRLGQWDIYASISTDGVKFSRDMRITDSNDNEVNPAIAVDGQSPSQAFVAWQDDRDGNQDIYVAASANVFTSAIVSRVTVDAADQTEPDIAVDAQNAVYVVWTDRRNGSADIYAAASAVGPWTNVPVVTGAGDQTDPALAAEPGSSILHLAWVDDATGDRDIHYGRFDGLPGSPIAGDSIIDDTSGADQIAPAIACNEQHKVFVCWQDSRNAGTSGGDGDLYMTELSEGTGRTNVLVGEEGSNANQSEPALGVDRHGQPYVVWVDERSAAAEIYYAATTFIDPNPLDFEMVVASAGATIGTEPSAIKGSEDVSIVVPPGACPTDFRVVISRIINPQVSAFDCLGSYDFGPSGIDFDQPVTVIMPYRISGSGGRAKPKPYWYDSLTGMMSQQGITDIENITISSNLNALRFKTTHFTPYYVVAGDSEVRILSNDGGGCSLSPTGDGSPGHLLVPYAIIAAAMAILRRRDRRRALPNTER